MGLETGTYIDSLNVLNPVASDGIVDADNHLRLLKSTIKATFPSVTGAVTPTHTELNYVVGVTSALQTQLTAKASTASLAAKADLASPALTGTPTAPTAAPATNTTQLATTAFVEAAGVALGATKQTLDADLTAIAGLTATTDNFLQSKASAWASRTPTQATADLIAVVGDSGAGGTKGLVPAPAAGDAAANKFLKASGAWTAVTAGAWTLIATLSPAAVATIDQTGLSGYKAIRITGMDLRPATNDVEFVIRLSSDGTTYLSANYSGTTFDDSTSNAWFTNAISIANPSSAGNHIGSTATDGGVDFLIVLSSFNVAQKTKVHGTFVLGDISGTIRHGVCAGAHTTQTAMQALRFFFSSGNITSGTIVIEGMT